MPFRLLPALMLLVLSGCSMELHHDLTENSANEIIEALNQRGITAEKARDDAKPGQYMVLVSQGDSARAISILRDLVLPRPISQGFAGMETGALVPSELQQRAQFLRALGEEVHNALAKIPRVLDSHVIVMKPDRDVTTNTTAPVAASVVLTYLPNEKNEPPVTEAKVQQLVAASVEGLKPEFVSVILTPGTYPAPAHRAEIVRVGYIDVLKGSETAVRLTAIGAGLLMLLMACFSIWTLTTRPKLSPARARVR